TRRSRVMLAVGLAAATALAVVMHGRFRDTPVTAFAAGVLISGLIVAVYYAIDNYRRFRERELRSAQLEAQLARAELQLLGMRLHPHLLFNAIHSISALMHRDVEAADRMMGALGDLLRAVLRSAEGQEVTLAEELRLLGKYVDVMQIRFGARLCVVYDVDPTVRDALVPCLVLQPVVENAILHGVARASAAGRVEVRAHRDDGTLRLTVRDDGPGMPDATARPREGVGLSSTRARLRQLYGAAHRFELANHPAGGAQVTISVPLRVRHVEAGSANAEGVGDDPGVDRRRRAAGA
ncbi:MAG: sensor histidine kinase, partial [Gemmatimonadaceae bacterium]